MATRSLSCASTANTKGCWHDILSSSLLERSTYMWKIIDFKEHSFRIFGLLFGVVFSVLSLVYSDSALGGLTASLLLYLVIDNYLLLLLSELNQHRLRANISSFEHSKQDHPGETVHVFWSRVRREVEEENRRLRE